jgi:hypothetical protein
VNSAGPHPTRLVALLLAGTGTLNGETSNSGTRLLVALMP